MSEDNTISFDDRRREIRHSVALDVNYRDGTTYLYSKSSNISEMGIFIVTENPSGPGSKIELRFSEPGGGSPIEVTGEVVWIDPGNDSDPGMGLRFIDPSPETRDRIKALIRTVAYID